MITAQNVYSLRQRTGHTQTTFARLCWTSPRTIQRWEAGTVPVDPARFELLAIRTSDATAAEQVERGKGGAEMSRKYTLLMTGDRTGLVGEHGNTFASHPELYKRLDVIELTPMSEAAPDLYEALEAALNYIDASPCDPDITMEQLEAWSRLQSIEPRRILEKSRGES